MTANTVFELPGDIVDIDEYTEYITILLYGDPGIGKTRIAGSARNPLILATENGTVSARKSSGNTKVWDCINSWEKFEEAYEWLAENAEKPGFPFDWVCVDTGTQLQLNIRRDIVDERVEEGTAKDLDPDKVHLDEYGKEQQRLMRYITLFNALPVNVLWTAHAMLVTNEEGEEFKLPNFHGKGYGVANWIAAQMHLVGYMHFRDVKDAKTQKVTPRRVIEWRGTDRYMAKDRFDALGPRTIGMGLAQITDKIVAANSVEEEAPAPKKAPAKKAPAKKAPQTAPNQGE
ncbi:Sak4-like ssDNA annealing protein [Gordonia phage Buggaboo]|uniref:RecA-like DNA recombinase n=2 Tax=Kablunavirus TaxID=2948776 RepID=A0A386KEA9_9CAUD|nr:Sak4-like ssDNA annealing protein [Gordonia phage Buggaboo]YP_010101191.1 Sak4-like ssDNA annealing protein [Gordonia phage NosilaM]AVE00719.1 RecA-like DNA recombinase [Gordonia phage SuperSulley]AYD83259.1 RecA-like DNA recombinase [Gordonia phage Buggaboo]QAU07310.1 RecA-like DNA recombinase [Gordonia phage NosilaM]